MAQEPQPDDGSFDLREQGRGADGKPVFADRRLYLQVLAYGGCRDPGPCIATLAKGGVTGALYADLHDPAGIALAAASEDPGYFTGPLRDMLARPPFGDLAFKPELAMFGRTYAIGYEENLEQALIQRPLDRLCRPEWPWAVWYPVRRAGVFEQLPPEEQRAILMEHAGLGARFSSAGHGYDIRLACHGLDRHDNDFVLGLVGPSLQPLSAMVQAMRKTRQTSQYLAALGPFLVGKALWQGKRP